jgi:hypothetical protein
MTATGFVKKFTTGKLPGIELERDEQERIELTKRLMMGDLPQDFDDDELDFIGSWNGDNGDGAFPNVKVLEIYDLAQFGTEPSKFTWPLLAEFLRSEKEEWESHRPKGKRGHAQFALDVAIGDCFKAGMNSDEIAENCERMCDEREMEPDRRNRDGSYNAICPTCYTTVARSKPEAKLAEYDKAHVCDSAFLAERGQFTRAESKGLPAPSLAA